MTQTSEETQSQEMVRKPPLPLHNGVLSPDRWTLFGRIATTIAGTEFVPKDMRGKPEAVMAALLYGDSLGLHPSTALTDIFIVDGKPGVSGALMLAKVREAGHKITFEDLYDDNGGYVGSKASGQRIVRRKVVEEDSWTYTMQDAHDAGLYPNSNPKAAWMKTPKVMCRWRAVAQLVRFLFPDVMRGGSIYTPDEAEEIAYGERIRHNGAAAGEGTSSESGEIDYGDDPLMAAWLVALFAAANEIEPGIWLPAKVRIALRGMSPEGRETLAYQIAEWIEERGAAPPERPVAEESVSDGDFEVIDDPTRDGSSKATSVLSGDDELKLD